MRRTILPAAVIAAIVAVSVAACGGGDESAPPRADPPAAAPPSAPSAPPSEPAPSDGSLGLYAPIPGGGLPIEEALASTLEGPLVVKGYVVSTDGKGLRLCSVLLESYPPQCGGVSVVLADVNVADFEGLKTEGSTTWTEGEVSVLGTIENGVLTSAPNALA